tara:strand:- start:1075 stop:1281 length:207 start_codon:yes stop_codon:yes gene_type:complete
MTEREFVVTRKSENGSCVIIPDEEVIKHLSELEIKTLVINTAIVEDMWQTDRYESDDTLGLTYEVEEQ